MWPPKGSLEYPVKNIIDLNAVEVISCLKVTKKQICAIENKIIS